MIAAFAGGAFLQTALIVETGADDEGEEGVPARCVASFVSLFWGREGRLFVISFVYLSFSLSGGL